MATLKGGPKSSMDKNRYAELGRILQERRREMMSAVHDKIRDVRTDGASGLPFGVPCMDCEGARGVAALGQRMLAQRRGAASLFFGIPSTGSVVPTFPGGASGGVCSPSGCYHRSFACYRTWAPRLAGASCAE